MIRWQEFVGPVEERSVVAVLGTANREKRVIGLEIVVKALDNVCFVPYISVVVVSQDVREKGWLQARWQGAPCWV